MLHAWFGVDLIVFWVFSENGLNSGFSMFSCVACLGMPYRGYGCIPCFILKIPIYGMLVLEFDSDVWGFKSVL